MNTTYGFYLRFVVIGLAVLMAACGPAGPAASPGSVSPSPEEAGPAPTVAAEDNTAPEPTATGLSDGTASALAQESSPSALAQESGPSAPAQESSPSAPTPQATETIPATEDAPQSTPSPTLAAATFPAELWLEPVLSGFELPAYVAHAGEETAGVSRLFIVEKAGRIQLVEDGAVRPAPFLDITDRVGSQRNEQGLLSVAFPPDFASSDVFYVNYTDRRGDTVIARYRLMDGTPDQADPDSEQILLQIDQPAANHNGGQIQFGPDGYLYIGTGDGGQAGDPWGNAQNPGALLGKMLRVDVTGADSYEIPSDNPLLDQPGARPEIWATGTRNPWRFSFDRATGDLYMADVGQNMYEEVNFQAAASRGGENYGWDVMEGNHCFEPASGCDVEGLVLPVAEYDHGLGCSITGGYVYRGSRYPNMAGVYFYGDFCSGNIWGLRQNEAGEWETALLLETDLNISTFGEDAEGEIYVASYNDGSVYRLAASP